MKRIKLAWDRIQDHRETPADDSTTIAKTDQPELLIMGDFNCCPWDPLYSLLVNGTWPGVNEKGSASKYHLPAKVSELTASSLPLLPLRDTRADMVASTAAWTYAPGKQIFDYIFVSDNIETIERHDFLPRQFDPKALKPLSSCSSASSSITTKTTTTTTTAIHDKLYWPNKYNPSDHVPIGATVRIQTLTSH